MSKHTPGPWRIGCLTSWNGTTLEPEAFVYRLDRDNPEETAHNRICVRGSVSMDCDADARLIAAAPEQNDALHTAPEPLGQSYTKAERLAWLDRYYGWFHGDRASVIAKAEGKS